MKKDFLLSTLFIGILLVNGCKKEPPLALFSMDKVTYKMDETITFTNQSENAKDYIWDFGDGKSSTDENPKHAYSSTGDFAIKLIATGGGGTDSITKTISILPNLTGIWYKTIFFTGGAYRVTGTMNLVQHDDNTLTGSFVYDDGAGTMIIRSTSIVTGNSVTIDWDIPSYSYKFQGTVIPAGNSMSGQFFGDNVLVGTWSAKKL